METNNGKPTVTGKSVLGETTTHPSYGTLLFSRSTSSGPMALFGSSIKHRDTVTMRLFHADVTRGLSTDHYSGKRLIAEAEMSMSQFAEAISSMNIGTGVPVTLRWLEGQGQIEPCDFVSKREQFNGELTAQLDKTSETARQALDAVRAMFDTKASIGKADRAAILHMLENVVANVTSNTAFIYKQFQEQMDKTVTEAKGEIEAFAESKLRSIALDAIAQQNGLTALGPSENPVDVMCLTDGVGGTPGNDG